MDDQLIYWILGGAAVYWLYFKVHRDDDGRIEDKSVTVDRVLETLAGFKGTSANGTFTEAMIQKQMFDFLQKHFVHVKREHGLEGSNTLKIDLEVGRKIGIEIKVASTLFKSANLHRLDGQINNYLKSKYETAISLDKSDLIVAVVGTAEDAKQRVYLDDVRDLVEKKNVSYIFLKVK